MNLDDLRTELRTHADRVDGHTPGRMAGIRAKAAQRKRRRTTGVVAVVVLIVGVVIGIPALDQLRSEPDPIDNPDGPFPKIVDGDTRIAQAMGDKGDASVTLTFTPGSTDFLLDFRCDGKDYRSAAVEINGLYTKTPCTAASGGMELPSEETMSLQGSASSLAPKVVGASWRAAGVRPGKPVTIRFGISRRVASEQVRLGLAVYEMTGPRVDAGRIALKETRTIHGRTYRLVQNGYDLSSKDSPATVTVPRLPEPALAVYGWSFDGTGAADAVTIDGRDNVLPADSSIVTDVLPDATEHVLRIEHRAGAFVAYYTLAEDD